MQVDRRLSLRWGAVLIITALIVVGATLFLREQLRPCAPLDLALRLSGCVRIIEVPNLKGSSYISVAPNGRYVAVTAVGIDDDVVTVSVIDLETERVVEEYLISEIESSEREPAPYANYSPDGTLTRDYQLRKRITGARSSDGNTLISFTSRPPCQYIALVEGDQIVREIPISGEVPFRSQVALSHDGSRLAVARGRLAAWDLETGATLIDLGANWLFANIEDFTDADWLPDNRTLVVGLFSRPARIALFELPEVAPTPDPNATLCQPETDEVRRWWVEGP